MKLELTTLNLNQKLKANNGNTLVLQHRRSSCRQRLLEGDGFCFWELCRHLMKERGNLGAGEHLLQNNAPIHCAQVAVDETANCGFEMVVHLPYSPGLVPSGKKSHLRGHQFESNDEVICNVDEFLEDQYATLRDGIAMTEHQLIKCIDIKGNYIEKNWKTYFSDSSSVRLGTFLNDSHTCLSTYLPTYIYT